MYYLMQCMVKFMVMRVSCMVKRFLRYFLMEAAFV